MSDRFVDFDAAWQEKKERTEPVQFRIFGHTWDLPGTLPAGAVLKVARMQASGRANTDLSFGEMLDIAAEIVPGDTLDAWCAKGLDTEMLADVLMAVLGLYGFGQGDGQGEAEAPAGPTSSSPVGASSSPTSPASTGST